MKEKVKLVRPKEISEIYLNKIAYGDLKKEFEEIGVPEAFKPGKKKDWLIKEALGQLALLKELKEKGIENKDILINELKVERSKQLKEVENKKEKEIEVKNIEEAKSVSDLEKGIREKDHSLNILQKSKESIDVNLAMNIKGQRKLLLQKREIIMKLISEKE